MRRSACNIALAVVALAAGACAAPRTAGGAALQNVAGESAAQVRAAIDTAWREHIAAAVRKDLEAVLAIYAEDVLYVVPDAEQVRGLAAMRLMEGETLAQVDLLHATHTIDALSAHGDIAYELGTVVGPVRPKGGEAAVFTFHYMAQWVRGPDGVWRVRAMVGQS